MQLSVQFSETISLKVCILILLTMSNKKMQAQHKSYLSICSLLFFAHKVTTVLALLNQYFSLIKDGHVYQQVIGAARHWERHYLFYLYYNILIGKKLV